MFLSLVIVANLFQWIIKAMRTLKRMRKTATDTATAIVVIATMFGKNVTEK